MSTFDLPTNRHPIAEGPHETADRSAPPVRDTTSAAVWTAEQLGSRLEQLNDTVAQHFGKPVPDAAPPAGGSPSAADQQPPSDRPAWSDDALKEAREMPGGLNLFDRADPTGDNFQNVPPNPGERTYTTHGSPDGMEVRGQMRGVSDMAQLIRADQGWHGEPIRLNACSTGKPRSDGSSFAQDLANELGVLVTAPNDVMWAYKDGTTFVTPQDSSGKPRLGPGGAPLGSLVTFAPKPRSGMS